MDTLIAKLKLPITLQRLFGTLLFAFALGGCAEPPYINVNNSELKALLAQGVPLYDVRRPEEWRQTGVVEGRHKLTYVDAAGRPHPEFLPPIYYGGGQAGNHWRRQAGPLCRCRFATSRPKQPHHRPRNLHHL